MRPFTCNVFCPQIYWKRADSTAYILCYLHRRCVHRSSLLLPFHPTYMLFQIRRKPWLTRSLICCGFSESSQVSKHCLMDACLYVCSWKLINLMVRAIFCSACSYWKKTEKSLGCSVGSQTCSVNAGFLCHCSFLMSCWLCWARNAMFFVVVGTSWHFVFSMCPEGP